MNFKKFRLICCAGQQNVMFLSWRGLYFNIEEGAGDLGHGELLIVSLLRGDDGDQWEVNTWVEHQVGLELSEINIESSIKSKRDCDGTDNLADVSVEVGVGRSLDVHVAATDVVNGLVVNSLRSPRRDAP